MIPTRTLDHVGEAEDQLTSRYRDLPNTVAFLGGLTTPFQRLEEACWDVIYGRGIGVVYALDPIIQNVDGDLVDLTGAEEIAINFDASGYGLDLVGKVVGAPRNGRSDAELQIAVRVAIAVNRSRGRSEDIITILRLVSTPPLTFTYDEDTGESGVWYATSYGALLYGGLRELVKALTSAKAAGTRGYLTYYPVGDDTTTFTLSSAAAPTSSTTKGLGSVYTSVPGGHLRGVMIVGA